MPSHQEEMIQKLVQVVENISGSGCTPESLDRIVDGLLGMHRTHQQGFFRIIYRMIMRQAKNYRLNSYDMRNEDTCKACVMKENEKEWGTVEKEVLTDEET